jgi:hypothetical protein
MGRLKPAAKQLAGLAPVDSLSTHRDSSLTIRP